MSEKFDDDLKHGKETVDAVKEISRTLYPDIQKIEVAEGSPVADVKLSVDLIVKFPDRDETWAVKGRRRKYQKYQDVTLEIENKSGSRGDLYRFRSGNVSKYVYVWRENGGIKELVVLDAMKLANIDTKHWIGSKRKKIDYFGVVDCYHNEKHGGSWFTAIPLDILERKDVILKTWKTQTAKQTNFRG